MLTYKKMFIIYAIAAVAAIIAYVVGNTFDFDYAADMWTTVWGLVILTNIYGIKSSEEKEKSREKRNGI